MKPTSDLDNSLVLMHIFLFQLQMKTYLSKRKQEYAFQFEFNLSSLIVSLNKSFFLKIKLFCRFPKFLWR